MPNSRTSEAAELLNRIQTASPDTLARGIASQARVWQSTDGSRLRYYGLWIQELPRVTEVRLIDREGDVLAASPISTADMMGAYGAAAGGKNNPSIAVYAWNLVLDDSADSAVILRDAREVELIYYSMDGMTSRVIRTTIAPMTLRTGE